MTAQKPGSLHALSSMSIAGVILSFVENINIEFNILISNIDANIKKSTVVLCENAGL